MTFKEAVNGKGLKLKFLAGRMGIKTGTLYAKVRQPWRFKYLERLELEKILGVNFEEMFPEMEEVEKCQH